MLYRKRGFFIVFFSRVRRCVFIFAALLLLWPAAGHALDVDAIRFGASDGNNRMVLELNETTDYRVFVLSDPYRLIVDLPEFGWNVGRIDKPDTTGVAAVRQGRLEPGISRIVFDLRMPIALDNVFLLPPQQGKPDRLVIDFLGTSADVFEREKEKIFGNLTAGAPKTLGHTITPAPAREEYFEQAALRAPPEQPFESPAVSPPPRKPSNNTAPSVKPLIVLDPGHGGNDPGAPGVNNTAEKNVVLALARELKKQLEATGDFRVVLTRDNDTFIRLRDRVAFARKHGADLFVSLHADSTDKPNVRGASVYTLSEKASDEQSEKLAARENRSDIIAGVDLSVEDEEVASILVDLAMRDTMNQSKFFANTLVSSMKRNSVAVLDNPHRHAGFAVLKAPDIPSVLVESGFMSNSAESRLLSSPEHRKKMANALKQGIQAYFEHIKK